MNLKQKIAATLFIISIATIGALALSPITDTQAHGNISSTSPEAGEILTESPNTIEIIFNEPMSVASLVVQHEDGEEVTLVNSPDTNETDLIMLVNGQMQVGTWTVLWLATSQDGHQISGAYDFAIVKPSSAETEEDNTANYILIGAVTSVVIALGIGIRTIIKA